MTLSRRTFIGSLLATAAASKSAHADEAPLLKFGLMSDTHVSMTSDTTTLLRQMQYLSTCGIRVLLVTGDVVDIGLLSELRRFRSVWDEAFPTGLNANGESCRLFVCWGNHDYHNREWFEAEGYGEDAWADAIYNNKNEAWRILMDEDFPGEHSMMTVGGVMFLTAHWEHLQDDLVAYLDAHESEIPSDRPVFFLQHSHPYKSCYGNWYAQINKNANQTALRAHPNFFVMSGHSHLSNIANDALWMGGFVSMGAGRSSGSGGRNFYDWLDGLREYNTPSQEAKYGGLKHMENVTWGQCDIANLITVYPSRVVVQRREFSHDRDLDAWDIAFPFQYDAEHPYPFADGALPPQFPAGAAGQVRVSYQCGSLYPQNAANGAKAAQVKIAFPAAVGDGEHSQIIDYLVSVRRKATNAVVVERLVAQPYAYGTGAERASVGASVVFGRDELPTGEDLVASITPLDSVGFFNGRGGTPIVHEFRLAKPVVSYMV